MENNIEAADIYPEEMCQLPDDNKSFIFYGGFDSDDYIKKSRKKCFNCRYYTKRLYKCRICGDVFCSDCCKYIQEKAFDFNDNYNELYHIDEYTSFICQYDYEEEFGDD